MGALRANAPKLTDEERLQICQWLATFVPVLAIQKRIKEQFGKTVARENIYKYASTERWKPLIERCRKEWAAGVLEIPLAHKRARLEELTKLYDRAMGQDISEYVKINQALGILRELRIEMDERSTQITNLYLTSIQSSSDQELLQRRDDLLDKLKRIGGSHALRRSEGDEASGGSDSQDTGRVLEVRPT